MTAEDRDSLPEPIQDELARLVGQPEKACREAIEALCCEHPEHERALRLWWGAARRLAAELPNPGRATETERPDRSSSEPPVPERIGPYQILEELGAGGMGVVYKAEQKQPVRRLVALKLIKLGMDSRDVLARFELERRALAAMSHTSIAKVFEAGTTERGQPYFVMELVEGLPLTAYCDKHRLTLQQRIALFEQICVGVQHAHQKGVIHRDLKPGNILVVREGDQAVPKILDFGLAKATNRELLAQTIYTERERILGTPEYMAPEQAACDEETIDTRADIYSLGVILYELLAGELPFPADQLRRAGWAEIQRKLAEDEPPRPSTKITTGDERVTTSAHRRRTTRHALARDLRGDLDWIVVKAMAKEPERRYASATGLADDLERHLAHEPVVAGPPSATYRIAKLFRRYRGQVVAGVAVFAAVIIGLAVSLSLWSAAEGERQRAQDNLDRYQELRTSVLLRKARDAERELYPAHPEVIDAIEGWLVSHVEPLRAAHARIEKTLRDVEAQAIPQSDEEKRAERTSHPRLGELQRWRDRLASIDRADAVRKGGEHTVPVLDDETADLSVAELQELAWDRVAPDDERVIWGGESYGLAVARRLTEKARDTEWFAIYSINLAWAYLAVGLDREARETVERARSVASDAERATVASQVELFEGALAAATGAAGAERRREAVARIESLQAEVARRRDWRFADPDLEFLHESLSFLAVEATEFEVGLVAAVQRRLSWARGIEALTRAHPRASATWEEARSAIQRADGKVASTLYSEQPIDLQPQWGLVPIGMNPQTLLWEFYHLRSACDLESGVDPASIAIPTIDDYDEQGKLPVDGDSGMVFVLIPGGTFTMGARDDPLAESDEKPHEETVGAFFLARHELTQGQWMRLGHDNPSRHDPGSVVQGASAAVTLAHPVEQVSWPLCRTLLRQHGLALPREAEWEYGCRAGTATPWHTGDTVGTLEGAANLFDERARAHTLYPGEALPWDDRFVNHAPVGSYRPNAFGLCDMHGNVLEWCEDLYRESSDRVYRGGCFTLSARYARSSDRNNGRPEIAHNILGVRAARPLRSPDR